MGHRLLVYVVDGVAPASCRHVCCAKTAGEMSAVKPARRRRYPPERNVTRGYLFSGWNTVGRWKNHEIDTVVESHPNLARNARLGWAPTSICVRAGFGRDSCRPESRLSGLSLQNPRADAWEGSRRLCRRPGT